jgi:hypothetical protein
MWREAAEVWADERPLRGWLVVAKRRASRRASFSLTAASMIAPRSPSGTCERMRERSRSSFSWSRALAVNCTLYRPGARGRTTGGGRGGATSRTSTSGALEMGARTCGPSSSCTGPAVTLLPIPDGVRSVAAGGVLRSGSLRIRAGTSCRGVSSAISSSISRLDRCVARRTTGGRFSSAAGGRLSSCMDKSYARCWTAEVHFRSRGRTPGRCVSAQPESDPWPSGACAGRRRRRMLGVREGRL